MDCGDVRRAKWRVRAWSPRRLLADRSATVGLEWSMIALPFAALLLCTLELVYDLYAQEAMDMALQSSARQIAVGSLQGIATSAATFEQNAFCTSLGLMLPCQSIMVNVRPVQDFVTGSPTSLPTTNGTLDPSKMSYCPGAPGQLMLAQAIYPAPSLLSLLLPYGLSTFNGKPSRMIVSSVGFVNEDYTVTAGTPAGC